MKHTMYEVEDFSTILLDAFSLSPSLTIVLYLSGVFECSWKYYYQKLSLPNAHTNASKISHRIASHRIVHFSLSFGMPLKIDRLQ